MARLPTPGGDTNSWGEVLNDFLAASHNADGSLKTSAITSAVTAANLGFDATGSITSTTVQTAVAEVATDAAAALAAHAADTTQHGAGVELAVAHKSDALFATASTTPVAVPGLSISFTVPSRPYIVKFIATGLIEEINGAGTLEVWSGGARISEIGPSTTRAASVNQFASFASEGRIPGPFHAPTAGATVTYELRANTNVATSDFTVLAGNFFGVNFVATLVALVQ